MLRPKGRTAIVVPDGLAEGPKETNSWEDFRAVLAKLAEHVPVNQVAFLLLGCCAPVHRGLLLSNFMAMLAAAERQPSLCERPRDPGGPAPTSPSPHCNAWRRLRSESWP